MNIRQKDRFFFFTHAITLLSLFTYSVCHEKVKSLSSQVGLDHDDISTRETGGKKGKFLSEH